jgi:hypothetical protein
MEDFAFPQKNTAKVKVISIGNKYQSKNDPSTAYSSFQSCSECTVYVFSVSNSANTTFSS